MKKHNMLLSLIAALSVSGCELAALGNNDRPDADPDKDGLTNSEELNTYFTNPDVADTDGDGISDGDEVNAYGFNPASNVYRFNPLIADLPSIGISIDTVPELVLRYTDSTGKENSVSNSNGGSTTETDKRSYTGGVSVTLGVEKGIKIGSQGAAAESKVTASVTGSFSTTEESSTANQKTWETVTKETSSSSRETDGAILRVGVSVENTSNLSFSLEHITLVAKYMADGELKPFATLSYDVSGGGYQSTSFSPGEKSNTLLFSNESLDLDTGLNVLRDARRMVIEPALYELKTRDGTAYDFNEGDVEARSAFVLIDYGIERPQEKYFVSMIGSHGEGSVTLDTILSQILNVGYVENSGLSEVRDVGNDPESRWVVVHTQNDGILDATKTYDPEDAAYSLSDIEVYPGDTLNIVYLTDVDGDGIGIREEYLNGTDPEKWDTDGDGLSDYDEIRNVYQITAINVQDPDRYPAYVKTNPLLADADGDTLTDIEEVGGYLPDGSYIVKRGTDPNNPDTDGDGINDKLDIFNGEAPIAASFTITPLGGNVANLTGLVTPKSGMRISKVDVDWETDGEIDDTITATSSAPISVNLSYSYQLPTSDSQKYDISIYIESRDDAVLTSNIVNVTYVGSFEVFQEKNQASGTSDFTAASGWREDEHIRTLADMDNDGDLDLVGFGGSGVWVSLWDENALVFTPVGAAWVDNFGAEAPGNYSKSRHQRNLIDWDGDGLTDIVAFGEGGVVWSKNCGDNTLRAPASCGNGGGATYADITSEFGYSAGWRTDIHLRTFGDVDGNGLVDIIGFGNGAVLVLRNLGLDASGNVNTELVTMDGGANRALEQGYGTAFTSGDAGVTNSNAFRIIADIDGDGRADIVNVSGNRMLYSLGQIDGSFSPIGEICTSSEPCFTAAQGWTPANHLIFLEDVNNDNKPDLVGFGASAVFVSLNQSSIGNVQFGAFKVWNSDFVYNKTWRVGAHPRYLADVNGDGYKDIIGFSSSNARAALNQIPNGEEAFATQQATLSTNINLNSAEWVSGGQYNNRLVGDFNNDGRADVVGFGNSNVIAQRSPGIVQPSEQ